MHACGTLWMTFIILIFDYELVLTYNISSPDFVTTCCFICRSGKRFSCPNGCLRHSSESSPTERNGSFYQANHQQPQQQQHRSHGVCLSRIMDRRRDMTLINPWPQVIGLLVLWWYVLPEEGSNYSNKLFCLRGLCAFSCRETFSHSFVLNSGFSIDSWQKDGLFSQPNFLIFSGPANAGHEDIREAGLLSREHQEHRPISVRVKYWTFSISVTIMM